MSMLHSDGYVVDVIDLFQANLNDVTITKEIFETRNSLVTCLPRTGQINGCAR